MQPRSFVRTASFDKTCRVAARWFLTAALALIAAVMGSRAHATAAQTFAAVVMRPWSLVPSGVDAELAKAREPRLAELSDQEYFFYSGVGAVVCTINGQKQMSTAFLVGSFDLAVTVAHTFLSGSVQANASDCVYTSTDSTGQIRERLPVAYYKSQWIEAVAIGVPGKDLAVVRLAQRSTFAQRTLPLGKFSGYAAPVIMIGFSADMDTDTFKRKSRGTVYERDMNNKALTPLVADIFTHDMDALNLASGAPVLDERSGVIIGVHTSLVPSTLQARAAHTAVAPAPTPRNALITMDAWLENTLRAEIAQSLQTPQTNETH
jgi:V8-like Glu-specific endopeptidase